VFSSIEPPDPNHPDEADYWGPDSVWKLDDPIWFQSRHFEGMGDVAGQNQK